MIAEGTRGILGNVGSNDGVQELKKRGVVSSCSSCSLNDQCRWAAQEVMSSTHTCTRDKCEPRQLLQFETFELALSKVIPKHEGRFAIPGLSASRLNDLQYHTERSLPRLADHAGASAGVTAGGNACRPRSIKQAAIRPALCLKSQYEDLNQSAVPWLQ
jgi:hypothetical protein